MPNILKDDSLFPYLQGIHLAHVKKESMLTIRRVVIEPIASDRGVEDKWVIYFDQTSKGLILNKTNTVAIVESTGEVNTDRWPGKVIRLAAQKVKVGRDMKWAIRVNPLPPTDKMLESVEAQKAKQKTEAQKVVDQANEDLGLGQ